MQNFENRQKLDDAGLYSKVDPMALLSGNVTGSTTTVSMEVEGESGDAHSVGEKPIAPAVIPRGRINSLPTVTGQQSPMERLGGKIEKLVDFIEDKKNVHHEIRKLVKSIATAYKLASKAPQMMVSTTQTSPRATPEQKCQSSDVTQLTKITGAEAIGGLVSEDNGKSLTTSEKRKERTSPDTDNKVKKRKDLKPSPLQKTTVQNTEKKRENAWQAVLSKKEKRKQAKERLPKEPAHKSRPEPKRKKPRKFTRPDALIIRPVEKAKYAEILRRIKNDVPQEQARVVVDKVLKTNDGNMLITLSRKSTDKGQALMKTIKSILKEEADVICKGPEEQLEIRDIDDETTKNDVQKALQEAAGDDYEIPGEVIKIRPAYRGTQTALVRLPAATAQKILGERGKIRIGWVNCRIRTVKTPLRCYKCWHFGHTTVQCKSEVNRSGLCIKCGQTGHQAAQCSNKVKCVLCAEKPGSQDTAHRSGAGRCPVFQEALQKLTNKRT